MKILKYLLLLLLVVAIGLGIYAALQPSEYEFTHSKVVKAPVEVVYNLADDYKNWERWGPWHDDDPTIKVSYNEKTKGPGVSYSWSSEEGDGTGTRLEAVPYESLSDELNFDGEMKSTAFWKFKPADGGTEVTWGMRAKEVPFGMKFFSAISGGYKKMMTPMFERGLEKLDSVAMVDTKEYETAMNSHSLGDVAQKAVAAQQFVGFPHTGKTSMDLETMQKMYMESLPKAGEYAMEQGLEYGAFTPGTVFTKWDEETDEAAFVIGVFTSKDIKPGEGMLAMNVPAGNRVMVAKYGNYGTGDKEAHEAIIKYIEENNLTVNGPIYEMYVNDPTSVPANEIQTDIYYQIN